METELRRAKAFRVATGRPDSKKSSKAVVRSQIWTEPFSCPVMMKRRARDPTLLAKSLSFTQNVAISLSSVENIVQILRGRVLSAVSQQIRGNGKCLLSAGGRVQDPDLLPLVGDALNKELGLVAVTKGANGGAKML